MAFRFSLESVLKFRHREEESAQREYVAARSRLEEALRKIDGMYDEIDQARAGIAASAKAGKPSDLEAIRHTEVFIEGQKVRIQRERQAARNLISDLEAKEEILLTRMNDRKIMEKLKERKLEEYKAQLLQLEQKELDDLTNTRMAGGRR